MRKERATNAAERAVEYARGEADMIDVLMAVVVQDGREGRKILEETQVEGCWKRNSNG